MGSQGSTDSAVFSLLEIVADPKKSQKRLEELKAASEAAATAASYADTMTVKAKADVKAAEAKTAEAEKLQANAVALADKVKEEQSALRKEKAEFNVYEQATRKELADKAKELVDKAKALETSVSAREAVATKTLRESLDARDQAEAVKDLYEQKLRQLKDLVK